MRPSPRLASVCGTLTQTESLPRDPRHFFSPAPAAGNASGVLQLASLLPARPPPAGWGAAPPVRSPGSSPLPALCGAQGRPAPSARRTPGPAPPPWPRRGVPGGGAARSGVYKAGGARQGRGGTSARQSAPRSHPCKYEHNGASPSLAPASKLEMGFCLSGGLTDQ